MVDGDAERRLWHAHATGIWDRPGAIVRASWLPANIGSVLADLKACATRSGDIELVGRAAVGAGLIRIDGDAAAQAATVERLRASQTLGNVVLVRGSAEVKALVDVWGSHGDHAAAVRRAQARVRSHGILNAGRGPL